MVEAQGKSKSSDLVRKKKCTYLALFASTSHKLFPARTLAGHIVAIRGQRAHGITQTGLTVGVQGLPEMILLASFTSPS